VAEEADKNQGCMKVVFPENSQGFCFGVKRAIDIVLHEAKEGSVDVIGYLVHNPEVIANLSKRGVRVIAGVSELTAQKVAITAHGAPRGLYEQLPEKQLIDATCPYVKRLQKTVDELDKDGYQVVILGDLSHPEVISVCSYARNPIVISGVEEAESLGVLGKVALVCQTTQNTKTFDSVVKALKARNPDIEVVNTICPSTTIRQNNASDMKGSVGAVVIVGGKMSANTKRLVELVSDGGLKAFWIEEASELTQELLFEVKTLVESHRSCSIGLLSGASTPLETVLEVKNILENT